MLIGGFVLDIAVPATVTWRPKSKVLASEKPLEISFSDGWKDRSLVDTVITVDPYETYDYWFVDKPIIFEVAKNFVINGTAANATEQSFGRLFNFYVFDNINFDLWKTGSPYTSYYEAEGTVSVNFNFSIATKDAVPDTFYFVVKEYVLGVKPVVLVTSTISWTSIYDYSDYFAEYVAPTIEESKDFVLWGNASEVAGKKFNFYILDADNYRNWKGGETYTSYFEKKNITLTSFSIPLTKEQAASTIYFVAENPLLDTNETVKLSATTEWNEKATTAANALGIVLGTIVAFLGLTLIIIAGVAALVFKPKAPAPTPQLHN